MKQESFVGLDDQVYVLHPLNTIADLKDLMFMVAHVRYLMLRDLEGIVPPEAISAAWVEGKSRAGKAAADLDAEITGVLTDVETGLYAANYLVWMSLKKQYPDITRNDVATLYDAAKMTEIQEKINRISGWGETVKKKVEVSLI